MKNIYTPKKKMFNTTATILRGRGSSWVFLLGTFNKVSRLFSDGLQCGPKKSMPGSTHLQNSGYWGRRQVAKNGRIKVVRCLVEICPPLTSLHTYVLYKHVFLYTSIFLFTCKFLTVRILIKALKFAYIAYLTCNRKS
jgi:hypothetical protein